MGHNRAHVGRNWAYIITTLIPLQAAPVTITSELSQTLGGSNGGLKKPTSFLSRVVCEWVLTTGSGVIFLGDRHIKENG